MRRSKGFILVEILTGMALQAGFILVTCVAFYMMLTFYTRTQQLYSAREKGQRVISYIDSRIINAGLGLYKCQTSNDIYNALKTIPASEHPLKDLILPVSITSSDKGKEKINVLRDAEGNITTYRGNILTLLYARKELASERRFIVFMSNTKNKKMISDSVAPGTIKNFSTFMGTRDSETDRNEYKLSQFSNNPYNIGNDYLNSWGVLVGSGVPVSLSRIQGDQGKMKTKEFAVRAPSITPRGQSVDIYAGDEFLYLECERMFVANDNSGERNFSFKTLSNEWSSLTYYHEKDILEIYMELGTEKNNDNNKRIFTLYVLSSGGHDLSLNNAKPLSWPENAPWDDDYTHHVLYVSRKSWRLDNLSSFRWN